MGWDVGRPHPLPSGASFATQPTAYAETHLGSEFRKVSSRTLCLKENLFIYTHTSTGYSKSCSGRN